MSTFPRSPHTLKAGLALLDPVSLQIGTIIALQYAPDQLTRTLQVQGMAGESGDRSEPLRLKGPPVETFRLEAEIDATDQLEQPQQNPDAVQVGIFPQLAVLGSLVTPTSTQITNTDNLLLAGAVEVAPAEAPLALFVWSSQRVVPVRVTELSITEEAFDVNLNPIRAKVTLALRVLSVNDFNVDDPAAALYIGYLKNQEALARRFAGGSRDDIGLKGL
ncbi:hypothetical protein FSB08_17120 [Paraburkholderia sp. JPY432]|uniref:hypothetical protein n=1 Tax=Paraburkholderia youngii TaxID=2782701 RepID=UPI001595B0C4|nr:hypothetical protein [Paraburkholderia youngii]NVH74224.1 hypothetical protein [Paraburkholderia youngii]